MYYYATTDKSNEQNLIVSPLNVDFETIEDTDLIKDYNECMHEERLIDRVNHICRGCCRYVGFTELVITGSNVDAGGYVHGSKHLVASQRSKRKKVIVAEFEKDYLFPSETGSKAISGNRVNFFEAVRMMRAKSLSEGPVLTDSNGDPIDRFNPAEARKLQLPRGVKPQYSIFFKLCNFVNTDSAVSMYTCDYIFSDVNPLKKCKNSLTKGKKLTKEEMESLIVKYIEILPTPGRCKIPVALFVILLAAHYKFAHFSDSGTLVEGDTNTCSGDDGLSDSDTPKALYNFCSVKNIPMKKLILESIKLAKSS